MEAIDIKDLTIEQLKALAWDQREQLDQIQQNLHIIRQQILLKQNEQN